MSDPTKADEGYAQQKGFAPPPLAPVKQEVPEHIRARLGKIHAKLRPEHLAKEVEKAKGVETVEEPRQNFAEVSTDQNAPTADSDTPIFHKQRMTQMREKAPKTQLGEMSTAGPVMASIQDLYAKFKALREKESENKPIVTYAEHVERMKELERKTPTSHDLTPQERESARQFQGQVKDPNAPPTLHHSQMGPDTKPSTWSIRPGSGPSAQDFAVPPLQPPRGGGRNVGAGATTESKSAHQERMGRMGQAQRKLDWAKSDQWASRWRAFESVTGISGPRKIHDMMRTSAWRKDRIADAEAGVAREGRENKDSAFARAFSSGGKGGGEGDSSIKELIAVMRELTDALKGHRDQGDQGEKLGPQPDGSFVPGGPTPMQERPGKPGNTPRSSSAMPAARDGGDSPVLPAIIRAFTS